MNVNDDYEEAPARRRKKKAKPGMSTNEMIVHVVSTISLVFLIMFGVGVWLYLRSQDANEVKEKTSHGAEFHIH